MTEWEIFDPVTGFGGDGPFIEIKPEQNPLGIEYRTGGGCVKDGPFTEDKFKLNLGPTSDYSITNPHCLTRDFAPDIARTNLIRKVWDEVLAQPDYGSFARRLEGIPSWDMKNVHGGGHFGVGGVLGTIGDGKLSCKPLVLNIG
jgi:tyrosinase